MKSLAITLAEYTYNEDKLSLIITKITDQLRKIALNRRLSVDIIFAINGTDENEVKMVDGNLMVYADISDHLPIETMIDHIALKYYHEGLDTVTDYQKNLVRISWETVYSDYKYDMENAKKSDSNKSDSIDSNNTTQDDISSSTRITTPHESSSRGIGAEKHCP